MIPFLLAAAGGYLIAQSQKKDTFAKGGRTDAKTVRNLMNDIKDTYDHDSLVTFVEMPDTPVLKEVTDKYVVIKFPMITGY